MKFLNYLQETTLALEIGKLYKTKKSAAEKLKSIRSRFDLPKSILKDIDDLSIEAFGYKGLGYRWFVNQVERILHKKGLS